MTNVIEQIEIWKDIPGYEGRYQASTLGNVRSLITTKALKKNELGGYLFCYLRNKDGVKKSMFIHRAVLLSFVKNEFSLPVINHKNAIRSDNRVENLEWCTSSYNNKETYKNPNRKMPKGSLGKFGELHHNAKPILQKDENGNIVKRWECMNDAFRAGFQTHRAMKLKIKYKGYFWEYENRA